MSVCLSAYSGQFTAKNKQPKTQNSTVLTVTSPRDSCFAQWSSSAESRDRGEEEIRLMSSIERNSYHEERSR